MASGSETEQPQDETTNPQSQSVLEPPIKPTQRPLPLILDNGITELWCPPASTDVVADICFVHGLMGHPFKTWNHRRGSGTREASDESKSKRFGLKIFGSKRAKEEQNIHADGGTAKQESRKRRGCYWPLDLIPDDFVNVRVITYGYDSHPSHFFVGKTNQMTITQHASNLLQQLTNNRIDCVTRPIIFVAHSLGGILVKDAIIQSGKYENDLKYLSRSCRAIFFFGTPHHGSSAARYGEIVTNIVGALPGGFSMYKDVLRGLKPNGEKLSLVEGDFNQILNQNIPADEKIQLYSFQESKGLSSIKLLDGKVVPDSSSFFNRKDVEQNSHVNENHMDMARFRSASSPGYLDFTSALRGFLAKIQSRRNQTQSAVQKAEHARLEVERRVLLEIIDFKERCVRQQQISGLETTKTTFKWIWTSAFKTWLKDDTPFFWISGKPASGKSTLMNYIAHAGETIETLQNAHAKQWNVIYFFFDFRARDGIGNNIEGFVRCLLFQLCQKLPNILQNIPELKSFVNQFTQDQSTIASPRQVPLESLKKALLQGLQSCSENILLLLDGLDEYEGRKVELTNFIKTLRRENIKICTASRPEPLFLDAFAGMPTILMQELNFDAIKSFSLDVLVQFYSARQYDPSDLQSLAEEVAQRSQGVFLWARFAVHELIEGLSRGEGLGSPALEQRLGAIPEELQQIYSRIFQRFNPAQRKTAALFLLLICYKEQDVPTDMLAKALCYVPSSWAVSTNDATSTFLETDNSLFSRRLLAYTGGIVEVFEGRCKFAGTEFDCNLPRLIHRTADTYLELSGWKELLGDMFTPELGHEMWIQICTEAITRDGSNLALIFHWDDGFNYNHFDLQFYDKQLSDNLDHDTGTEASSSEILLPDVPASEVPKSETLLLSYAAIYVLDHAGGYEKLSKISSRRLLGPCFTPAFMEVHPKISGICDCTELASLSNTYNIEVEPVDLSASHNLVQYVEEFLQEGLGRVRSTPLRSAVDKIFSAVGGNKSGSFSQRLRFLKAQSIYKAHMKHNDDFVSMLTLLLNYGATVEDHDLLAVVGAGTPRILRLLLAKRKSLSIGNLDRNLAFWHLHEKNVGYLGKNLTLLAGIGLRRGDSTESREIFQILEERGAHINDQCGPLGGVVHYFVATNSISHAPFLFPDGFLSFLSFLVEKGADVNLDGPRGKPLELVWRLVHSSELENMRDLQRVRDLIRALLDHDAVNELKDPNGLVPSKIQMSLFGCNWTDYEESRRYYRLGPRDWSLVWPGPVPVGRFEAKAAPEFGIPHEEAMAEYRAAMGLTSEDTLQRTGASADEESS